MPLKLTPEIIGHYWDALILTPPFDKWNLPPSEDIKFSVYKKPFEYGYYRSGGDEAPDEIGIGPKVGLLTTLGWTLGHEGIHMHLHRISAKGADHGPTFRQLWREAALHHGWDPNSL